MNYSKNTSPTHAFAQADGISHGTCGAQPKSTHVETQIYVHRLSHIDQKEGIFHVEGYFRLWWNDPRLKFNGTVDGGCEGKLVLLLDSGAPVKIWHPDVFFENSKSNKLGQQFDGNLLEIYPNGDIFWVRRIRADINCHFNLARLPWDEQACEIDVSLFSQTIQQVNLTWTDNNNEGALANLHTQTDFQWLIGGQHAEHRVRAGISGEYASAVVSFDLKRNPQNFQKSIWKSCVFVLISYLGSWIDAEAAPARITLATMMILIVITEVETVQVRVMFRVSRRWLQQHSTSLISHKHHCAQTSTRAITPSARPCASRTYSLHQSLPRLL